LQRSLRCCTQPNSKAIASNFTRSL
jgi:hypothetical protein